MFEDNFEVTKFEMLQCLGCCTVVLCETITYEGDPSIYIWSGDVRFFPPKASRHMPEWCRGLPQNLWPLLDEVYRSLDAGSMRLPLMGARTLVDMVINEKVGDVGTFREKLATLEKEGYISAIGREILFAALDAGSAATHRGYAASAENLEAVMGTVENLLQAVYVLPRMANRVRESTPPRKTSE